MPHHNTEDGFANGKSFLKKLGAIIFGFVWALIIAEIMARILVAQGKLPSRLPSDLFVSHPVGWSMEPNLDAFVPSENGLVRIQVNSAGFRDRDYPQKPEPGHRRILILGDSFVAAIETSQEQTFHKLLEARYEGKVDVISMGISGYQPTQEYLIYRQSGRRYDPDVVVLMLYVGNDINGIQPRDPTLPYFILEEDGTLSLHQYPYSGKFTVPIAIGGQSTPLMKMSRAAFLAGLVWQVRQTENTQTGKTRQAQCDYIAGDNYSHPNEEQWLLTEALILAMRDEVESDGHRLHVVIIPTEFEIESEQKAEFLEQCPYPEYLNDAPKQDRLIPFFETSNIVYLDLRGPLIAAREQSNRPVYLNGIDTHWTPYGHTIVAEALYEWLDLP